MGNEVLRRVNHLMDFLSPQKENAFGSNSNSLGVNDLLGYIDEQSNPAVRKYKNVVR